MNKLVICTQVVDMEHPILGFFHGWIKMLATEFDEVEVIALEVGKYQLPDHVQVHSLGKERGRSKFGYVRQFYHLFRLALKTEPQYIFFHMGAIMTVLAAPFYFWSKRKRRRPQYLWWKTHGQLNWLGRIAAQCVDRIYTAGQHSFGGRQSHVCVIGHAIDTAAYPLALKERQQPLNLLVVGRITPIKNIDISIAVLAALKEQSLSAVLRIVGPVDDPVYYQRLNHLIASRNLTNEVTFVGAVKPNDIGEHYRWADFLIHPVTGGGFDKVVLEAALSGVLPVTTTPSCQELLADLGLFSQTESVEVLRDLIVQNWRLPYAEYRDTVELLHHRVVAQHALKTLPTRLFHHD